MKCKTQHKLTIGLTGGILCGKSTALAVWQKQGAYVLSCDELVREISARPSVQKKIEALLAVSKPQEIARKVFTSASARKQLEQLLHPLVRKEIAKRLASVTQTVRVVEVPLLFEAGWQNDFDLTVAVVSSEKNLTRRLKQRHLTKSDFLKRQHAQLPAAVKAARADICIVNDGASTQLAQKVQALHGALCKIYNVK